jgi:hypothetical protein
MPSSPRPTISVLLAVPGLDHVPVKFDADGYAHDASGRLTLWRTTDTGHREVVAAFAAGAVLGEPDIHLA